MSQTFMNWELHVIDNHSTDDTIDLVHSFNDPRIHLHTIANEGIIARSRNLGIQHSTGKYIAFLDSDDRWYEDKLLLSVNSLDQGADVVCHGELWIGGDLPSRRVMYGPSKSASTQKLIHRGNCLSTSAVTMRHSLLTALSGFREDPRFITAEDYDLWIRSAKLGATIIFIPTILGEFRRSAISASSDIERNVLAEIAVCDDHLNGMAPGLTHFMKKRQRHARAWYGAGRSFATRGNSQSAWRAYGRAISLSPFIFRLLPAMMLLALRQVWR